MLIQIPTEHLVITLYKNKLPEPLFHAFDRYEFHSAWRYLNFPSLAPSPLPLEPIVVEFARNIDGQKVTKMEAHDVFRKLIADIMEYAARMMEGAISQDGDKESENGFEEGNADDTQTANAPPKVSNSDSDSASASASASTIGTSAEDKGISGEISNWSFTTVNIRLQSMVDQAVTLRLIDVLHGAEARAAFCCGGRIPISTLGKSNIGASSLPVVIRFDTSEGNVAKVTFDGNTSATTTSAGVGILLQQCQPASFGIGGEEVHDKSYRDALKLDPTRFSTKSSSLRPGYTG